MVMYQSIKFGCKRISSSVDMVETVISDCMSPHCDTEVEDSKPVFLHNTLAQDDASPYLSLASLVTEGSAVQEILPR